AVAAFLAWRARPRVDPVAEPAFTGPSGSAAPPLNVVSSSPSEVVVAVAGKVRRPGLVRLPAGSRVADALAAAGGVLPGVDLAGVNLARKVGDGEQVAVGVPHAPDAAGAPAAAGAAAAGAGVTGAAGAAAAPLDLNT